MRYLSYDEILFIHSVVVDETGGSHGVRDQGALLALEALPKQSAFGKEMYPTVFEKAALYIRNIIFSHPFIDGNKRSAMTSAAVFLEDNGYHIVVNKGEIEAFALSVIADHLELANIAALLQKNSKKKRSGKKKSK